MAETCFKQCSIYVRADEHVECGKLSLAGSIHCCPNSFYFFCPSVYLHCEVYVYVYTYLTAQTVYELLLPPSNTASETLLYKSGAV